ncbi:MAG: hypothetical protein RMX68_012680 [Aulosira sp. ZfuVER01]|nr:hypothetical protein [Aulosira sp. ZfuVER01]MDZ7999209.1 hypothetical protein [Aulosira sp. DedVER01a]MDZ8052010.1 hypothetical protein [Aulosira sp. ZfuCHP01]
MLISHELRWFYPGKLPDNIQVWFQQNCLIDLLKSPEEREDLYLYSPGCDFLGIKLRQGRLEVKWRQAELGVMHFGGLVTGKGEKWGKWLCEDSKGESFQPAMVLGNPSWVSVQKVRYSQLFQVLADFSVQAVTTNEHIDNGCSVEITNLTVQENTWWSLAFEAFGEDSRRLENLQATAIWVFHTYQNSRLAIADSYAYPHWLGLICR